jgi:hypothetical protein
MPVKKKKAVKKTAKKTKSSKTINYNCRGGTCTATPKKQHLSPGAQVTMQAGNADATIDFAAASGSPFASGTTHFFIPKGTSQVETVAAGANGHFPYKLACTNPRCRKSSDPPEVIVP